MEANSTHQARAARRVTLIGAVINGLNGLVKILVGSLANSQVLIADGIHSLSDLVSDALVLVAIRLGHQQPDSDHPYGHGRFETVATLLLGGVLIAIAGGIAWDSLSRLLADDTKLVGLGTTALLVTLIAIASKEWLFHYTMKAAKDLGSKLLEANAWHHRTDSLSSIVVLVALVGSMLGYHWLDQVGTVIVGLMIAHMGIALIWESLKELVDTAIPEEQAKRIRDTAKAIPGVVDIHDLRTRTMGRKTLMDLHIRVLPDISVSEGHQIGVAVSRCLYKTFDDIGHITFHIDPEADDGTHSVDDHHELPLRPDVLRSLDRAMEEASDIQKPDAVSLHYLDQAVDVDLFYHQEAISTEQAARLKRHIKDMHSLSCVRSINIWSAQLACCS